MAEGPVAPVTFEYSSERYDKTWGRFRGIFSVNVKAGGVSEAGVTHTKETGPHKKEDDQVLKVSVEAEIGGIETEFEGRIDEKKVVEAIRKGSIRDLFRAMTGAQASHAFKPHRFGGGVELGFDAGVDLNKEVLPLLLKGKGSWAPPRFNPPLKCVVEIEAHLGPSRSGWIWIGNQVGKETIVRFCQEAGLKGTLNYLVSEGIVTLAASAIGGLVGTAALVCLAEYVTRNARAQGEKLALKMGYRRGFLEALFHPVGKSGPNSFPGSPQEKDTYAGLYDAGRKDAVKLALSSLSKLDVKPDATDDNETKALIYGLMLQKYYASMGRSAEAEVEVMLMQKMERYL